MIRNSIIL